MTELLTKDDVSRFELKMDEMTDELKREIRKIGRETMLSLIVVLGVLNAITFTAYALSLTD